MGLDVYKVSYSESWRPSSEFMEWMMDNLQECEYGATYIVPEGEGSTGEIEVPEKFKAEFQELIERYGGQDVSII